MEPLHWYGSSKSRRRSWSWSPDKQAHNHLFSEATSLMTLLHGPDLTCPASSNFPIGRPAHEKTDHNGPKKTPVACTFSFHEPNVARMKARKWESNATWSSACWSRGGGQSGEWRPEGGVRGGALLEEGHKIGWYFVRNLRSYSLHFFIWHRWLFSSTLTNII